MSGRGWLNSYYLASKLLIFNKDFLKYLTNEVLVNFGSHPFSILLPDYWQDHCRFEAVDDGYEIYNEDNETDHSSGYLGKIVFSEMKSRQRFVDYCAELNEKYGDSFRLMDRNEIPCVYVSTWSGGIIYIEMAWKENYEDNKNRNYDDDYSGHGHVVVFRMQKKDEHRIAVSIIVNTPIDEFDDRFLEDVIYETIRSAGYIEIIQANEVVYSKSYDAPYIYARTNYWASKARKKSRDLLEDSLIYSGPMDLNASLQLAVESLRSLSAMYTKNVLVISDDSTVDTDDLLDHLPSFKDIRVIWRGRRTASADILGEIIVQHDGRIYLQLNLPIRRELTMTFETRVESELLEITKRTIRQISRITPALDIGRPPQTFYINIGVGENFILTKQLKTLKYEDNSLVEVKPGTANRRSPMNGKFYAEGVADIGIGTTHAYLSVDCGAIRRAYRIALSKDNGV